MEYIQHAFTGGGHTICLSDDGIVYSFGENRHGQLGTGHKNGLLIPTPIPNLRKIEQISCGAYFTYCLDYEGFVWAFGSNCYRQLGVKNKNDIINPTKIKNIPQIQTIYCGGYHALLITTDSNLVSIGRNEYGELCHGHKKIQFKPKQTNHTNIAKISAGNNFSLFQNIDGEIFGCGDNRYGQLGSGDTISMQVEVCPIVNQPPHIIHFCCGYFHSLFLDMDGNVFSVGDNENGSLGLNSTSIKHQTVLTKIPNIPSILAISCSVNSSYLLDNEQNIWSFGNNDSGQLGLGNTRSNFMKRFKSDCKIRPKKIKNLPLIQQMSSGCCGSHFLVKDVDNKIFAVGSNSYGQLGTGDMALHRVFQEINPEHSNIWGAPNIQSSRAKSARK